MDEQDGHAMLVARCKALEEIAISLYKAMTGIIGHCANDKEAHHFVEQNVESRAPGCGHKEK